MSFEPQKAFIELMDFFSILLLTYLLMGEVGPYRAGRSLCSACRRSSLGCLPVRELSFRPPCLLLGSWLDEFYDWVRRYTLHAARPPRPPDPSPARALVWLVFNRERNLAVDSASRIKQQALGPLQAKDAINTFQWSKALLNVESPSSLAVVQPRELLEKAQETKLTVAILNTAEQATSASMKQSSCI